MWAGGDSAAAVGQSFGWRTKMSHVSTGRGGRRPGDAGRGEKFERVDKLLGFWALDRVCRRCRRLQLAQVE